MIEEKGAKKKANSKEKRWSPNEKKVQKLQLVQKVIKEIKERKKNDSEVD